MPLLAVILILADTTLYRTEEKGKISWIKRVVSIESGLTKLTYESPENRIIALLDTNLVPMEIRKWHLDTLIYELEVRDSVRVRDRERLKVLGLIYPFYDRHTLDYVLGRIRAEKAVIYLPEKGYEKVCLNYDEDKITLRPENFFLRMFGVKFEFWFDSSGCLIRYQDAFGRKMELVEE
ncbi:MAG TPA: hypothetical protein EYP24_00190 [bacterium (Candidatus Stahlbacteria)]|nr:hypothetical protein [Candidatus Stahlbacteria bacterium]